MLETIVASAQARLVKALRARGTPERARHEKAYQKSRSEHWGVPLPGMDAAIRETLGDLGQDEALELCRRLWRGCSSARKTATCWPARDGDKGVVVGKRWIVKDGRDKPRAVLETVELTRRRLGRSTRPLLMTRARATGRLTYWRRMHTEYFTRRGEFSAGHGALLRAVQAGGGASRAKPSSEARPEYGRPSDALSRHVLPAEKGLYPSTNCARGIPCAYSRAVRSA